MVSEKHFILVFPDYKCMEANDTLDMTNLVPRGMVVRICYILNNSKHNFWVRPY